ncbi:MAG: cysteine--tRNA ligase [Tistlia sp.]|uniref:cysteine--tRNA ligase n=1 Tax=Tistlia sp. TaxID=3057121 RepID=UPI0034A50A4D
MSARPLQLFNSLGRRLESFAPLDPHNVRIYSCGPTVYHFAHIGNLRAYVFTDTLRRALTFKGYNVTHVINITDVGHLTSDADEGDDKMDLAARRENKTIWQVAAYYTEAFFKDLERLQILQPSVWPRATDHIQEMIDFALALEAGGYTYALEDGLYFDTARATDYGRLGLLDLAGQEAGKRVAGPGGKRNPSDFAIWRRSPGDQQRQMEWHSPWGVGAPGWHLECSVMSFKYLGEQFDIHTGGIDHRQVHHCNEIAQNQGYTRSERSGANLWMHNEFLIVRDAKMSKSTGDFLTLQSLVDQGLHPAAYRLFLLTASYRSELEFDWEAVVGARTHLRRLLRRVGELRQAVDEASAIVALASEHRASRGGALTGLLAALTEGLSEAERSWIERLDEAVSNDLGTPVALTLLGELLFDRQLRPEAALRLAAVYELVLGLGLLMLAPEDLALKPAGRSLSEAEVEARIAERQEARKAKDFARADALRDGLLAEGVALRDEPGGTAWEWLPLPGAAAG